MGKNDVYKNRGENTFYIDRTRFLAFLQKLSLWQNENKWKTIN
jgi:hypothetical protein